jgi:hypothetical protein
MRLPADATLIVIGAYDVAGAATAPETIGTLIKAWRREELPTIDARGDERRPEARALAGGPLEAQLDDLGATTLVLCGEASAVETAAREAAALGFRVFIVRDACWTRGEASCRITRTDMPGAVVDAATALAASAVAKARQRWSGRRTSSPSEDALDGGVRPRPAMKDAPSLDDEA